MTTYREFSEVAALDDASLRSLLTAGEPPERVWAAWTMGLRGAVGLERTTRHEPSAGVRRHLVVVLLGSGERDAVAALLADDPDPLVRATACLHLARVVGAADGVLCRLLVARARADGSAEVRAAFAHGLPDDASDEVTLTLLAMLDDADRDVRLAVVDALARRGDRHTATLSRHLAIEPVDEIARAIIAHRLQLVGIGRTFEGLVEASERIVTLALEIVAGRLLPDEVVRALLTQKPDLIVRRTIVYGRMRDTLSLGSLIDVCLHGDQFHAEWRIAAALAGAQATALSPYDRARALALHDDVERRSVAMLGRSLTDAEIAAAIEAADLDDEAMVPWVDGLSLLPDLRRILR